MVPDALLNSLCVLAHLEVLPPSERRLAAETAVKLAEALVYVAVIGEFKRGKSKLINALLGKDVLPTGVTPVTAVPTLVRFGPAARAVIYRAAGSAASIPLAQLPDYVTERGQSRQPQARAGGRGRAARPSPGIRSRPGRHARDGQCPPSQHRDDDGVFPPDRRRRAGAHRRCAALRGRDRPAGHGRWDGRADGGLPQQDGPAEPRVGPLQVALHPHPRRISAAHVAGRRNAPCGTPALAAQQWRTPVSSPKTPVT